MKIKVLGTRGEVEKSAPHHSKHSGVLIDKVLLLDLGEKEFLEYNPRWIFVSHLHPDHAVFINESLKTNIPIYSPEEYRDDVVVQALTGKITVGSYIITPIPTYHSKKVKTSAYLIEKNKHRLLYTGDMISINKKYHRLLGNLDLVITEGSFIRKGGLVRKDKQTGEIYGHAGIPNLIDFFQSYTKQILLVHFGSWFYRDTKQARKKLQDLGQQKEMKILISYDGMEIEF